MASFMRSATLTPAQKRLLEAALRHCADLLAMEIGDEQPAGRATAVAPSRDRRAQVAALLQAGSKSAQQIADALGLTRGGALKWINRLETERLIEATGGRRSSPFRRYRLVRLTRRLDVAKSVRAKRASRQVDEQAIASGTKTRDQLARDNSPFAGLKVIVDFASAKSLS